MITVSPEARAPRAAGRRVGTALPGPLPLLEILEDERPARGDVSSPQSKTNARLDLSDSDVIKQSRQHLHQVSLETRA